MFLKLGVMVMLDTCQLMDASSHLRDTCYYLILGVHALCKDKFEVWNQGMETVRKVREKKIGDWKWVRERGQT